MKNDEAYFDSPVRVGSISTEEVISDGLPVGGIKPPYNETKGV